MLHFGKGEQITLCMKWDIQCLVDSHIKLVSVIDLDFVKNIFMDC